MCRFLKVSRIDNYGPFSLIFKCFMELRLSKRSVASVRFRQHALSQKDTSFIEDYVALVSELEAENDLLNIGNEPINLVQIQINTFLLIS